MKLSLIGMSGAGKSHLARTLSVAFRVIDIDDRIAKRLNLAGISVVADWMGWPDEFGYCKRELEYLDCEILVMNEALDEIQASGEDLILDTSGSVVYTGEAVRSRLKSLTTVVYLEGEEETLIQRYLSNPKPVLWGNQFDRLSGESTQQAVVRCYPRLLAYRKNLYEHWRD